MSLTLKRVLGLALVLLAAGAVFLWLVSTEDEASGPSGAAGLTCDAVAEPGDPVDDFVAALAPGQTACFREGVHSSEDDIKLATPRVTLSSYPQERATLEGRLWIARGADRVTVENLALNGRNPDQSPGPTVNADGVRFRGNDVTNDHTAICFVIGDDEYGEAAGTLIERNRIHDCGELPPTNHHHGVYVAHADRTVIRDNAIYRNADRGIQLYPDADRSVITGNVIDGNGEGIIFSGNGDDVSENNLVEGNVITNSSLRFNVEASWPEDREGTGNLVRRNCIFGGARAEENGGVQSPPEGFSLSGNIHSDPMFADRDAGDFRLREGSPCAELMARTSP